MRSTTAAAFRRLSLLLAILPVVAAAQGKPVTVAEANAVFDKVDASIRKVLKMPAGKASNDKAERAVTRQEVLAKFDSLFEAYRPKFAYTPRPFRNEPDVVSKHNKDKAVIDRISKLATWGFIAPVGPLAVGPSDTLDVVQFGDAVGYFMSQVAALTYYADPNFVPNLIPPSSP